MGGESGSGGWCFESLVFWLPGGLLWFDCLVCWLLGCLVGWMDGWMDAWLACCDIKDGYFVDVFESLKSNNYTRTMWNPCKPYQTSRNTANPRKKTTHQPLLNHYIYIEKPSKKTAKHHKTKLNQLTTHPTNQIKPTNERTNQPLFPLLPLIPCRRTRSATSWSRLGRPWVAALEADAERRFPTRLLKHKKIPKKIFHRQCKQTKRWHVDLWTWHKMSTFCCNPPSAAISCEASPRRRNDSARRSGRSTERPGRRWPCVPRQKQKLAHSLLRRWPQVGWLVDNWGCW